MKFADDFENRDAFKLTERHRTERFKDFMIKNHIEIKNASTRSILRQINPLVKLWI